MKFSKIKRFIAISLAAAMIVTLAPVTGARVTANTDLAVAVEENLVIKESEINQLLTKDLQLPSRVSGLPDATITYSIENANAAYVSVAGNLLKVTRPYAGEKDYSFTLTATVGNAGESYQKTFPLTIRAGLSDDSYAGYLYTCFANKSGADVQQVHFFLSEDGLNWTALNGCNPAFLAGEDYIDYIEKWGSSSNNYKITSASSTMEIAGTVKGDASVLFPFEGADQGIRDPYLLRGTKADGSDSDKIWILATDLNTMDQNYSGVPKSNVVGNWGTMSSAGSTSLFIYETEDWTNWERRYVDVGSVIGAGAAWAPEAIYNSEKDNYLVYWSCRIEADGYARNRIYCNETEDFVTFGPTKLYEQEDFYKDWGEYLSSNDGYGNIDTSQLWVADESGNPYGTVYRVVKDETNNHIQLMSSATVLDASVNYAEADPLRITPYTKGEVTCSILDDILSLDDFEKADVVWNWFKEEAVGNHFTHISQSSMESNYGAYEGATMFKFFDRDEWCVMIDNYGSSAIRYEPYTTTDLSKPDSILKLASGYGRTGGDVGCHGGMIPITAKEYNTLINTYNADPTVDNYHEIDDIEVDKRELQDTISRVENTLKNTAIYTLGQSTELKRHLVKMQNTLTDRSASSATISQLVSSSEELMKNSAFISLDKTSVDIVKGSTATIKTASVRPASDSVTWSTANASIATVKHGVVTGVGIGTTVINATTAGKATASVIVTVTGVGELGGIVVKAGKTKLAKGSTTSITVNYPTMVKAYSPKDSYSASGAVAVTSKGKITAKKAGNGKVTVTVTVSSGEKDTKTLNFTVGAIKQTSVSVKKNTKLTVQGLSGTVKWSVNKKSLATITSKGLLKPKKKGTVTVTAKVAGVTIKQKIKMK